MYIKIVNNSGLLFTEQYIGRQKTEQIKIFIQPSTNQTTIILLNKSGLRCPRTHASLRLTWSIALRLKPTRVQSHEAANYKIWA